MSADLDASAGQAERRAARRAWWVGRLRGVQSRAAVGAQLAGGVLIVAGVGILAGVAVALIVGGVALVGIGTLREAKVI